MHKGSNLGQATCNASTLPSGLSPQSLFILQNILKNLVSHSQGSSVILKSGWVWLKILV